MSVGGVAHAKVLLESRAARLGDVDFAGVGTGYNAPLQRGRDCRACLPAFAARLAVFTFEAAVLALGSVCLETGCRGGRYIDEHGG